MHDLIKGDKKNDGNQIIDAKSIEISILEVERSISLRYGLLTIRWISDQGFLQCHNLYSIWWKIIHEAKKWDLEN